MSGLSKIALVASAVFAGAFFVGAQPPSAPAATPSGLSGVPEDSLLPFNSQRLGLIRETRSLIGEKVIDSRGKSLGKIQVLLCDLAKGEITAVLVRSGGKTPFTPIPATCFKAVRRDKAQLQGTQKLFEGAPHFALADSQGSWNRRRLEETFRYFGVTAPESSGATEANCLPAESLPGQPLASQANEPLGQIKNVFLDLPTGRIIYLVVEPAGGVGVPGESYIVPPESVRWSAAGSSLVLKAETKHFLAGYHFPKEFPSDLVLPEVAVAVYRHYGLLRSTPAGGRIALSAALDQAINP
jgi:sporulation protein YlmC with PRC-barrel domain